MTTAMTDHAATPVADLDVLEFQPDRQLTPEQAKRIRDKQGAGATEPEEVKQIITPLDPTDWDGLEITPVEWIKPNWIPKNVPVIYAGDGGLGKSTDLIGLCVAAACGGTWHGTRLSPMRVTYAFGEDACNVVHLRLRAALTRQRRNFADLEHRLTLLDWFMEGGPIVTPNPQAKGTLLETGYFAALREHIASSRCELLVLDSLRDYFSGSMNDDGEAVEFMKRLAKICEAMKVTIIILMHPSKAGMSSGRLDNGSPMWHNKSRARIVMQRCAADGTPSTDAIDKSPYRLLTVAKMQYGPDGAKCVLKLQTDGCLLPVDEADVEMVVAHKRDTLAGLLLQFVAEREGNKPVGPKAGRNYYVSEFLRSDRAAAMKLRYRRGEASKADRDAVRDAMNRLLDQELVRIDEGTNRSGPTFRTTGILAANATCERDMPAANATSACERDILGCERDIERDTEGCERDISGCERDMPDCERDMRTRHRPYNTSTRSSAPPGADAPRGHDDAEAVFANGGDAAAGDCSTVPVDTAVDQTDLSTADR